MTRTELGIYQPLISIIVPVFNPQENYLRAALESVINQTYQHWELCLADDASTHPHVQLILKEYAQKDSRIKIVFREENGHISRASNSALELATGEFIALLDHDDLLTPDALEEVVKLLNQHPVADMIYSDEDKIDDHNQLTEPNYKSEWCPDSFLSRMYTCHLGVYRRSLINEMGGFRVGFEGSQDYDLVLRLTEKTDKIFHIPKILYHWRIHPASASASGEAKPYAYEAAVKALTEAIHRRGESGRVLPHTQPLGHYTVRYQIDGSKRVSIIILTRDFWYLLNQCLTSIFNQTIYPNYEVIVIDNGSIELETQQVIEYWQKQKPNQLKCYRCDIRFNYSQLNNYAVRQATGNYLVFLNNDTKVIAKDWINALVEQAQRSSIGAVGGLLLYPDQSIQQAGFVLDADLIAYPIYQEIKTVSDYDSLVKITLINNISAVSGACLACQREKFEAVGGFDENLPIFYNDIDLCLKLLKQGYRNIYLPQVKLYHQELQGWNVELTSDQNLQLRDRAVQIMQERWGNWIKNDPCFSVQLQQKLKAASQKQQKIGKKVQPLVSVCIPTYNGEKYLKEALESVLAQTYSSLEIIISDDSSIDHTVAIAQSFQSKFSGNFKIFTHCQYGLAVNWNYAIAQAQGKYIKFLFQDDILEPNCIEKLVNLAEQDEEIGLVFSRRDILFSETAKSHQICQGIGASAKELEQAWSNLKPIQKGKELLADFNVLNPPLNKIGEPSTVLIKKSVFEQLGYFDAELQQLVDVEMWFRIMSHYKIGFINENLSSWRIHPQQLTVTNWLKGETRQDLEKFHNKICHSSYLSKLHPQVQSLIQNPTQAKVWIQRLLGGDSSAFQEEEKRIQDNSKMIIVTSIAPGNLEKQKAAITSWKVLGFSVVSLNSASEIEQLKSNYQDVTFQMVNRDAKTEVGKPLIYFDDILGYFREHPSKICGIVNSDIQLQADENFATWVLKEAENAVIFGSRIEIETLEQRRGELYDKGFDFFFFDSKYLKDFPASNFCLGLPWWDFCLPLIAWQRGWTLKRLVTPIAYHLKHSVNYDNPNWQNYGIEFTKFFNIQLSQSLQHLKLTNPQQLQAKLIEMANQFLGKIHQKSIPVEYPQKMIETQPILTRLSEWEFPTINHLNSNLKRPFWSVMIPTFNKVQYLEQTLRSVLEQAPGENEMQIEVINDCPDVAVQAELEAIVQKVGGNRIKFYRHSQLNIGQTAIFNLCLERAQGYWIHLLHDDDFILPGFYQTLKNTIEKESKIGAVFCRHYYVDGENNQRSLSVLERETPGILENWIEKIAVSQRIQPSSIGVKRSTYEQLGGFCPQAKSAADWEMWTRICAHYAIGYEPQILAAYRLHLSSWTSRLIQRGENISDTLKSIEISQSYLPENLAIDLSNKAREHYGLYAINTAQQLLAQGDAKAVIAQIQEALKCSQSDVVKQAIIELFSPQKPKAQIKTLTPAQILAEVSRLTEEYKKTNNPDSLRQIRQIVAQYWLGLESDNLEKTYGGEIGQAHKILLNSGLKNEALTSLEKAQLQDWYTYLKQGLNQPKSIQHLLAIILYSYPYQLSANWYIQSPIPKWFLPDYFEFMLAVPQFFQELGEAELYYRYLENWIHYIHERFISNPEFPIWQELAWKFTQMANFIPLYFNTANLKDIYIKRAEIMEFALTHLGYSLDYQFPQRPTRQKIRLGILSNHFLPQTETYSTLPVFEYLDSTQFEVILYALQSNNHPLEKYCQSRVERLVKLPKNVSEQVQLIRNDDLDILLIGTNVTAVNHGITLLGLHRLARIQVTSTSSCVTTGMRNIDYYISGTLTEIKQNPQAQYREKLILLEGTAHCFSYYVTPPEPPQVIPTRSSLGISEQVVVFISGANFYKIIPELRETWAKLLAKVPNSVLVLYPFNPNWASQYRAIPWINKFKEVLTKYGVDPSRLIMIKPQGSRSDIKEYLKLADIYLDSYPFSGVNSLVDPLEVGLVPVVRDGDIIPNFSPTTSQAGEVFVVRDIGSFRSLMAASLLRSLSINDLIANGEESYINLATNLANNPQLRQQKRQEIQQKIQQNPEFLDSRTYSNKMGIIFQQLFQTWQQNQPKQSSIQLNSRETIQQYLSDLVTHINHYELEPNNQVIINQLRSIRKIMVEHWLRVLPEQLERMYTTDLGKGYQILLNRGIQRELLTVEEEQFVNQITQQAIGLKQSDSLNHLMVLMLYYPPGKMVVANAKTRLPEWLLKEYQRVFENPLVVEKVQPLIVTKNLPLTDAELFKNRLVGCVNLYKIDPANAAIVEDLRQIRRQFADFWLGLETIQLESVYQSSVGQVYRTLLYSGFSQETLTTTEQQFIKTLASQMNQELNQIETIKPLLAVLLYCRPEQLQIQDLSRLPQWFRSDYEQLTHQ